MFNNILARMGQGLSVGQQSFPYNIGNPVSTYLGKSIWTLHSGTKKDDGSPVSIFSFDKTKNQSKIDVAKNGFKRAKTIRHPNFLTYLDGIEMDSNIYIVTEPIQPLDDLIDDIKKYDNAISWGIYQIAKALSFLNNNNNLAHGNINLTTIFVTKAGDWKLGSLDLVSDPKDLYSVLKNHHDLIPVKYKPPEILKGLWSHLQESPSYGIDSWMLGCLLYECYSGPMSKSEDVRDLDNIPKQLHQQYQKCFSSKTESRLNPQKFLESSYFQNIFVETCVFLENITLKDNFEKESFYKKLDSNIEKLPANICKFKIIPHLLTAFEFGPINLKILGIILKLSSNLTPEEYSTKIIPSILKWFASDDRALRINLLENLEHYIQHLSSDLINNQIFQHVVNGFNDNPTLKEMTVKSMILFAPKLTEKTLTQLLKYFAALQKDPLPGIRTNTTICLGRITEYLSDDLKKKVLIPAFSTALKDSFVPHANAGISAFLFTINYYNAEQIATRIIPELSQCLINPDRSIRNLALQSIQKFLTKLEKMIETMESPPQSQLNSNNSSTEGSLNNSTGSDGVLSNSIGWAMNYTKKLVGNEQSSNNNSKNSSPSTTYNNSTTTSPINNNTFKSTNSNTTSKSSFQVSSSSSTSKSNNNGWEEDDEFDVPPVKSKPTNNNSKNSSKNKVHNSDDDNDDDDDDEEEKPRYTTKKEDLPKMVTKPSTTTGTTSKPAKGGLVLKKPETIKPNTLVVDDNGWDNNDDFEIPPPTSSKKQSTSILPTSTTSKKSVNKIATEGWEDWSD
ncbi:hypothetical protein DLAC_04973 [Tieghemostelium lacteum]|uniref:Protein kinase domain-containing protein n=1 Tax=Tieghemostelium lacteum TaxID=361077 RepID=A0A151ZHX3_TIELA|nr:hypothetical protein DLAC_04973 [Tieghemostelium lacteum]|eukprot:KYQ93598.1 hypothetical protein DLAC_04973 [Tieghemostelium lacteum]